MKTMLCKLFRTALEDAPGWATREYKYALYGCLSLLLILFVGGCGGSKEGPPATGGDRPPAGVSGPSNDVLKTKADDAIRTFVQRVMQHGEEFTEANCKITGLQRGEPFDDASVHDLPSGHKVFPIRLTLGGSVKQPDARAKEIIEKVLTAPALMEPVEVKGQLELALYQNAFGDWETRSVKTEALRFRVDNGQWEPAPQ
jgi:hypothetical protein